MDTLSFWEWLVIAVSIWLAFRLGQASILMLLKEEVRERLRRGQSIKSAVSDTTGWAADSEQAECWFSVERHQGQYYAFAENGEFLAQGTDFKTLFSSIKQRFPNRNFRVQRLQTELTEEESGRMVKAIFETFGDNYESGKTTDTVGRQ